MQVFLSTGTDGDWVLVEEVGPVTQAEGGWQRVSFQSSAFIAPEEETYLHFVVSDTGAGSVVEAAFDDIKIFSAKCRRFVCGDTNNDGYAVDISDIAYLVSALFLGGPPLEYIESGDVNSDESLDIVDIGAMVDHAFINHVEINCP